MGIDSKFDFLDDLTDKISKTVGRKILSPTRYGMMQEKKREKRKKIIAKEEKNIADIYKKEKKRDEEFKIKERKYDEDVAKRMEEKYRQLGIELDLEGLSFIEIMDEVEKANKILDEQEG